MGYRIELLKLINSKGLNQKSFASSVNISENHFNKILSGDASLTIKMAARLELAGYKSAKYWAGLIAEEAVKRELLKYATI